MPETDPNQFNYLASCIAPKLTVFITQGFKASYLNYITYQSTIDRNASASSSLTDNYSCDPDCSFTISSSYLGNVTYSKIDSLTTNKLGDFITTSVEVSTGGSNYNYNASYSGGGFGCPSSNSETIIGVIDYGSQCVENSCGHVQCTSYNNCEYDGVAGDCHDPTIYFGPCGVAICIDESETSGETTTVRAIYGPNSIIINNVGQCCPDNSCPGSYAYIVNTFGLDTTITRIVYATASNIRGLIIESAAKRLSFIEKPETITSWDSLNNTCSAPYYPCGADKDDCWQTFLEPKNNIYGTLPYFIDYYEDEIDNDTPYDDIPGIGIKTNTDSDASYNSIWKFRIGIQMDRNSFNRTYRRISGTIIFYIDSEPSSDPCCMNLNDFTGIIVDAEDFELTSGSLSDFKNNTYLVADLENVLNSDDLQDYVGSTIKSCMKITKIETF
jgi:hypothetical protein